MLSTFAAPRIRGSASGFKPPAPGMSGKHTPGSGPPRRNSGAPDTKSAAKGAAAPGGRQVDAAAVENKVRLAPIFKVGRHCRCRTVNTCSYIAPLLQCSCIIVCGKSLGAASVLSSSICDKSLLCLIMTTVVLFGS